MGVGTCLGRPRNRLLSAISVVLVGLACAPPATSLAALDAVRYEPSPARFWAVNRKALMHNLNNGQCIQWAADKRPDIVRRAMEAIVAHEIAFHEAEYLGDWSARYWTAYARFAGIPTGRVPRRGAIAVFQPGVLGAAPHGHVAYVEKVTTTGWAYISQMHAPFLGRVSYQWLTPSQARKAGLTYIYR
jgi:hypothetical protein